MRKSMEKDVKIQRFERQGGGVIAAGGNQQYEREIMILKEKCEELEDTLKMVNDEKEAAQYRFRKEIN